MARDEWDRARAAAEAHGHPRMQVSSCQRIEVYHFGECACNATMSAKGTAALSHLAEVAAGLHSVVLGEREILGQVRAGAADAEGELERLARVAIAAARDLREEASLEANTGHLLDRALRHLGREAAGTIAVVGAGATARAVAARAHAIGFEKVVVASRTAPDAPWFDECQAVHVPLPEMASVTAGVVVTCLGSEAAPLSARMLPSAGMLIDLGIPPNTVGDFTVPVVTMATLWNSEFGRPHSDSRRAELGEKLGHRLEHRLRMLREDGSSPVGSVRRAVERIRQQEIERSRRLHPDIPAAALETITRSLVNQIFHLPSQRLRSEADPSFAREFAALFTPTEITEHAQ
ncbi:MAG: hypothetical protein C0506_03265 [Anaerolinea sp.]|nr:hypothetical protein [Anaerolinea sp.]